MQKLEKAIYPFTDSLASASSRSLGNVTVPLALLLDERLTPLERNAWMVFRARVDGDGTGALPNYEQMRLFLACKAGNQKAAYETASRTVCVLRMTRWVHLVGQCKAAGLSNMHGLRHRYAQDSYEVMTGWKAPLLAVLLRRR